MGVTDNMTNSQLHQYHLHQTNKFNDEKALIRKYGYGTKLPVSALSEKQVKALTKKQVEQYNEAKQEIAVFGYGAKKGRGDYHSNWH